MIGFLKLTERHTASAETNIFLQKKSQEFNFISIATETEPETEPEAEAEAEVVTEEQEQEQEQETVIEKCIENLIQKNEEIENLNKQLTSLEENSLGLTKDLVATGVAITNATQDFEKTSESYIDMQKKLIELQEQKNKVTEEINSLELEKTNYENEFGEYISILEREKEKLENIPNKDTDAIENLKTTIEELKEALSNIKEQENTSKEEENSKRQEISKKLEEIMSDCGAYFDSEYNMTITFEDGSSQKIETIKDESGKETISIR